MSPTALKLLSSMAARELLVELCAQYHRATGQPVACEAAGGVDVAKRVQSGEAVDVVVLASDAIDKLVADGKLARDSRVDLARSGIAVAVRVGERRPAVDSEAMLKQAVLAATTLSYSTGPSGVHLEKLFERWGILEAIRTRIVVPAPGIPVGSLIANGSAELGFQQFSELKNMPGLAVLGPLPEAIQCITIFSGGICAISSRPEEARKLLTYLASPGAHAIRSMHGMDEAGGAA